MATSIEILVLGAEGRLSLDTKTSFAIVTSFPPRSHRGTSSLWQSTFNNKQGILVHVGDPDMAKTGQLFWAFEMLEEMGTKRFRVLPKYKKDFFALLATLLQRSPQKEILFTSDYQFGPKPLLFKRKYTLSSAMRLHDDHGFRVNGAMYIGG